MRVLFLVGLLLFLPTSAHAQYTTGAEVMSNLTVSQTSTAVTLVDTYRSSFTVDISEASTSHCVWIVQTEGTCTDITTNVGLRMCRKSGEPDPVGWVFSIAEGWYGQLCVKAENTGVVLKRSRR